MEPRPAESPRSPADSTEIEPPERDDLPSRPIGPRGAGFGSGRLSTAGPRYLVYPEAVVRLCLRVTPKPSANLALPIATRDGSSIGRAADPVTHRGMKPESL